MSQSVQRIERLALLLTGAATLISLVLTWDLGWVLGVALGGLLGVGNFYALRRLVGGLIGADGARTRKQTVMGVLLTLKLGLLAAAIYLVIRFVPIEPLGLLCGISVVVVAIFFEGFRTVLRGAEPTFKSE